MKVLHVSGVKNWGGGEHHIQNLCIELARGNYPVENFILCAEGGQFEQKLKALDIPFKTASLRRRLGYRFIRAIISTCREGKYDLIHIHDPTAMQLVIIADHFAKLPPFVLSKKISFPIKQKLLTQYKYNYAKIKKYLCVSNETREVLQQGVTHPEKAITIYHGTRLDNKSSETPFKLREKLGLGEDIKIVGSIANHYPAKDLQTLVRSLGYLVHNIGLTKVHFVQLGKPSDATPEIMELVKNLGLESYISFLGFVESASNFIPQFDVGIISSLFEGIPQFIYECMYFRVPVVTTNAGGIAEVVADGETGFITQKGDFVGLAKGLERALGPRAEVEQLLERANQRLLGTFTTPVMATNTYQIYCEVLGL